MNLIVRQIELDTLPAAICSCREDFGLCAHVLWCAQQRWLPLGRFFKSIFGRMGGEHDHISNESSDICFRTRRRGLPGWQVSYRQSVSSRSGLLRFLGTGVSARARDACGDRSNTGFLKLNRSGRSAEKPVSASKTLQPINQSSGHDTRQFLVSIASSIDCALPLETERSPSLSLSVALELGMPIRNMPSASPVCALRCVSLRSSRRSLSRTSSIERLEQDCPEYAASGILSGPIVSGSSAQAIGNGRATEAVAAALRVFSPHFLFFQRLQSEMSSVWVQGRNSF